MRLPRLPDRRVLQRVYIGALFGYHAAGGMLIYTSGKIYAEEPRD